MIGTNSFINECKKDKVTYKEYIIINNTTVEVNAQTYFTAYKDTTFFGTFNLNYIKFTTENNISYRNKDFDYYKSVNGVSQKIGHYYVTEIKDNDTEEEVEVTAFDDGIKFNNKYETELNYNSGTITLYQVLQECCTKCGITLKNQSITNENFIVDSNQFEDNATYGDVICAVAQMAGCFAFINHDSKLELRFTNTTNEVIEDYVELEDKRDTQPITSVLIGLSADIDGEYVIREDSSLVEQYGRNWLKIYGNPFSYTVAKREQLIDAIFNQVKGFGYSAFTSKDCFAPYFELGDLVQVTNKDGENISSIVLRIETNYDEITVSAPSITSAEVDYINSGSDNQLLRNTRIQVDKSKQEITSLINQIGDRSQKTTTITQDIDSIEAEVENVVDVTRDITTLTEATLENCMTGDLLELHIFGNNEVFGGLYPSKTLYPSKILYPKGSTSKIKITDKDENETIYDLGIKTVLRYSGNYYDEFVLKNGEAYVIRRIKINNDGTVTINATGEIENRRDFSIPLKEGNNKIRILDYTANMYVKWVIKNDYTETFATKVDMKSSIDMTATEIRSEVTEEITDVQGEISSLSSEISQKASSIYMGVTNGEKTSSIRIQLLDENGNVLDEKTGNIEMTGMVTFTDLQGNGTTSINGANITTGTISSNRLDTSTINAGNGSIAGWTITNDSLDSATSGMSNGHYYAFYVKTGNTTPFYVTLSGDLICKTLLVNGSPLITTDGTSGKQITISYIDGNQLVAVTANAMYIFDADRISSDKNMKTNIKNTEINALDVIKKIKFKQFDWKETEQHEVIGVIAQEVEKIDKNLVSNVTTPKGEQSKVFNQGKMTTYNSKAIQELSEVVDKQQKTIDLLMKKIKELEEKI